MMTVAERNEGKEEKKKQLLYGKIIEKQGEKVKLVFSFSQAMNLNKQMQYLKWEI